MTHSERWSTSRKWGAALEEDVKRACVWYRERGVAAIYKQPAPPRGSAIGSPYGFAPVDFGGKVGERRIAFDVKSTTESEHYSWYPEKKHQLVYLRRVEQGGGLAFVLIHDHDLDVMFRVDDIKGLQGGPVFLRHRITSFNGYVSPWPVVPRDADGRWLFLDGLVPSGS